MQIKPTTTCRFCGAPCFVRQIPAPIPVSDAYCDNCVDKCRDLYYPARESSVPPGVIELENEDCEMVMVE